MNENVTKKTPKRRRWVARLLVSALCILLASSLLIVGVFAENIELVAQFSGSYAAAAYNSRSPFIYSLDGSRFVYYKSYFVYLNSGSSTLSVFDIRSCSGYSNDIGNYPMEFYFDGTYLYGFYYKSSILGFLTFNITDNEIVSGSAVYYSYGFGYSSSYYIDAVVIDSYIYGSLVFDSSSRLYCAFFWTDSSGFNGSATFYDGYSSSSAFNYTVFYSNGNIVTSYGLLFNIYSKSSISLNNSTRKCFFEYEGDFYSFGSSLLKWDIDTVSFVSVSDNTFDVSNLGSCFASDGVLYVFSPISSGLSLSYTVYTGLPTTEPPPESSDETTETPPSESSDDTSNPGDIPEGYTKIWRTSFDSDGTYSSRVIDALDLREVSYVRAFLGTFPSSESGIDSDDPIPLTLELYSGETLVDTVQYNFYAFGYSLSWMADYSFPDYVGNWIVIPLSDVTDIYFAENCPYGSVVLNSSLPVSEGGARISINFDSPDSYFTIRFLGNDLFSVYVYNNDPLGNGRQFDFGVKAYKKFSVGQYGNVITSAWYYPEESTSVTYYSSDVTEKGLYGIFFAGDSSYDTDLNMSKLEDISRDHELLESLAESIYGQYSFDSLAVGGFDTAISASDKILDSSGGSYILNYIFGMWTIHPFASAMIAIVGSLAIIGFIIRKM